MFTHIKRIAHIFTCPPIHSQNSPPTHTRTHAHTHAHLIAHSHVCYTKYPYNHALTCRIAIGATTIHPHGAWDVDKLYHVHLLNNSNHICCFDVLKPRLEIAQTNYYHTNFRDKNKKSASAVLRTVQLEVPVQSNSGVCDISWHHFYTQNHAYTKTQRGPVRI